MVYRPFQVLARQTAGGVITGVDYHDGRGLVPLPQFVPDPATKVSEGFSEDVNEDGFVDPIGQAGPLVHNVAPVYHVAAPVVYHVAHFSYGRFGYVSMKMSTLTRWNAGSTGNHKIMIRQGGNSCTTGYLTTGPWAGETYDANICMKLDMNKCVEFQVMKSSCQSKLPCSRQGGLFDLWG